MRLFVGLALLAQDLNLAFEKEMFFSNKYDIDLSNHLDKSIYLDVSVVVFFKYENIEYE